MAIEIGRHRPLDGMFHDDWGQLVVAEEWTDAEECARRMGITVAQLDDFARRGVVRSRQAGWESVEYRPCIVNVAPATDTRRRRARSMLAPRTVAGA